MEEGTRECRQGHALWQCELYKLNVWATTCSRAKKRRVSFQNELAAKKGYVPLRVVTVASVPHYALSGLAWHTRVQVISWRDTAWQ
jgi:hypothetical protein